MITAIREFYRRSQTNDRLWMFVAIGAACLVMLPMPLMGVPEGYDILDHLIFAQAYRDAIMNGSLNAPWTAASHFGLGSVGTRFYPPVADVVIGISAIFTGNWYDSFLVSSFLLMIPGCIGIYLWSREFTTPPASAMSAALYAVLPYHLFQIYQFTLFSEFAAASVLPFCLLYATRMAGRAAALNVLMFSATIALLIITHLPSTITGLITIGVYLLLIAGVKRFISIMPALLAAGAVAAAATSFYWLRLVTELDWVAHNTNAGVSGAKAFSFHLFPMLFTAPEHFYRLKMMWLVDWSALLTILLFVPVVVYAVIRWRSDGGAGSKACFALAGTGLFLVFLLAWPSALIWEYAPVLSKIQFPWRFLAPFTAITSLGFVIALPAIYREFAGLRRTVIYFALVTIAGVLVFSSIENVISSAPYSRELFEKEYGGLDQKSSCKCWLPAWANPDAMMRPEQITVLDRAYSVEKWQPLERRFSLAEGQPSKVRVGTFWYPHWKAEVNSRPAVVERDEQGVILVSVPAENSEVRLYFEEPAMLVHARTVSGLVWLALLGAIAIAAARARRGGDLGLSTLN